MLSGKVHSRVTKARTKSSPPPPSGKEVNGTQSCPKFQILSISSRNKHFEKKCQHTENVPDKIFYLIESSKPSLHFIVCLKRCQEYVYFAEICEKYDIFQQYTFLFCQILTDNIFADIFGSVGQGRGSWHLSLTRQVNMNKNNN